MVNGVASSLKVGYGYYNNNYTSVLGNKTTALVIRFKAIYNANNEVIGGIGIAEDISELKHAENILKKSEEKFRQTFKISPDSVNINRLKDGKYIDVNNGFLKITGYSFEEVIGKTSKDINVWANIKDRDGLVAKLKRNGQVENLPAKFRKKDGSIIDGLMSASIVEIDNEPHIISITRDITEIVTAKNKLKESEERFMRLSELTTEGVLISKDGIVLDTNKAFQEITGYTNNELRGKDIVEFIVTKIHRKRVYENLVNAVLTPIQIEIVRKDKKIIPIEVEAREIDYPVDGKVIKNVSVVSIKDITLRRQHELEIEKLTNAIEQSMSSIVITDKNGNIEYVNKSFTEITGYARKEVCGENPRILRTDYLDKDVYKKMWETISSGKTWRGEFHNRKKNGKLYWEKAVISPIKDNYGEINNYVAIKEDITEWKKAEDERLHLEKLVKTSVNEIYIFDKDSFRFSFLNDSAIKNTNYTHEEIRQLSLRDIIPELTTEKIQKLFKPLLDGKLLSVKLEAKIKRKIGTTYPVDISIQYVTHEGIESLVAIAIDITKRKEAEK
jgi:PAS domain S-box-containing protein